jgi:two-component system response regulator RegA
MARPISALARNVLVVDDDQLVLRAYERAALTDMYVYTATDAAAAKEIVRKQRPDVVIVDLYLGRHSGLDLIRDLTEMSPGLPLILVSSYASVEIAVQALRALRAGALDVIEKPVKLSEVICRMNATNGNSGMDREPITLARAQWEHVQRVLADCRGNISMTARKLGIYRTTLRRWLSRTAPPIACGSINYR